ncbi:hypothetical protein F4604DRAFT_1921829 [Suillus subluteus]|nr:hypothetical protein F4604DRAFT_1921829 [Suillus subluteus]
MVTITNHMDNDTGNPFAGYINEKYISAPVDNFLDIILKPWKPLINQAKEFFL